MQKCAPQTGLTERITQVDGAHWPLNRGCALPIGSAAPSRRDDRRTLLHEKKLESKMAVIAQGERRKGHLSEGGIADERRLAAAVASEGREGSVC